MEYDGLVYLLKSRFPRGFAQRLKSLLKDDRIWTEPILCKWSDSDKIDLQRKRLILAIFLLEELSLRMEENSNPMFNRLVAGFYDFINELPKALEVIK